MHHERPKSRTVPSAYNLLPCRFRLRTLLIGVPLAAGIIAWLLREPVQEVDAWIVVHQWESTRRVQAEEHSLATSESQIPHASRLKSAWLISQALQRQHVANLPIVKGEPDPVTWLQEQLVVEDRPQSGLVRISLHGPEPDQLRVVLNSIAAAYSYALRAWRSDREEAESGVVGPTD